MPMRLRHALPLSAFCSLTLAVVACGGASTSDLLTDPEQTAFGNQPEGSTTASGSAANAAPSAPATDPGTPGAPETPETTTDPGPETKDASGDPPPPPPPPPPPATKVRCGDTSCTAGAEVCCASITNSGKATLTCVAASTGCGYAVKIACDDQSDCPTGQVCCGARDDGAFVSIACRTTCDSAPNVPVTRLCDPKAAVDECLSINKKCESSESLRGFSVCR